LKADLGTEQKGAKAQARRNLFNSNGKKFTEAMENYKRVHDEFQKCVKERDKRAIQIVACVSDEQAEKIVESGEAQQFVTDIMVSDNLQELLREFEERHTAILALEREVLEVFELFRDMSVLVDTQQEMLDSIEHHITKALESTEGGEEEIKKAEQYKNKCRKLKYTIVGIIVLILIIIITVLVLQSKH